MSRARDKGTAWESRVVAELVGLHPRAERRATGGTRDRGDIAGVTGWVVECKNAQRVELGAWMDEAATEAANAGVSRYAVVMPRRRKPTAEGYAVVPIWLLAELMQPDGA